VPRSVNYHFTRKCNYSCSFCFHTSKTSTILSIEEAKKGLRLLKSAGMEKINFAGGEPFLYPAFLGKLCEFAKKELELNVSIVSNASRIKKSWMDKYARYVDILAISIDSFDEETNIAIGRGKGDHCAIVKKVVGWCQEYRIKVKINTVVNRHNYQEDMNEHIAQLEPFRWKVFQVLIIQGENDGNGSLRNASSITITKSQFRSFLDRHKNQSSLVPEDNSTMRNSYLILDEEMRFLNCSNNGKVPSRSILEVGVFEALKCSGFDEKTFFSRNAIYDWNKPGGCSIEIDKNLDW